MGKSEKYNNKVKYFNNQKTITYTLKFLISLQSLIKNGIIPNFFSITINT